jgi:arylsulfatase A-like enzyme
LLFQRAGYLSSNLTFEDFVRSDKKLQESAKVGVTKTDYNFQWDKSMYDVTHWSARNNGQPFFCQIQLRGGKYRGHGNDQRWPERVIAKLGNRTNPDEVKLPPYLPADPVILEDWAQYLDTVRFTDWQVGQIIERLREAGELERTYIFFITDHGISHVRNKQYCYDGGVHIPLIVRGPSVSAGTVRNDPVEHIDLAATSLALAGVNIPAGMQSRNILADDYIPRRYGVSARDRCDESVDRIRSLRSPGWKYIRNFYPARPYLMPNRYKDGKPIVQAMRRLYAAGKLNDAQSKIMAQTRPSEELYNLTDDAFEFVNLADDPKHQQRLIEMRAALDEWITQTGDRGSQPESEAMYDSDMAVYMAGRGRPQPKRAAILKENIRQMKQWAKTGK